MRALVPFVAALVLVGCDPGFRPETLVDDLRLIGVSAQPANLRPGETTRLTALVSDPSRSMPSTVLWVGCEADPFNLNRSPCANPAVLQDSSSLTGGTGTLPPGVSVIGFNNQAAYSVPAGLFDVLAPDDARRQSGTVGVVIAFAVADTVSPAAPPEELQALFERVQRKEIKSVVALFRVPISESTVRNTNPVVEGVLVGGERWPAGARLFVREGEPVTLDVAVPQSTFETYTQRTPMGEVEKTERLLTAWYSTAGRFSESSTAVGEGVKTIFTAPGRDAKNPLPERRTGLIYTVFRDTRGGQSWREWPFFVCEEALPLPVVRSVEWPSDASQPVVLRGDDLGSVLDVIVDEVALERGAFSGASQTWEGFLPAGVPVGVARGRVHTRGCTRAQLP